LRSLFLVALSVALGVGVATPAVAEAPNAEASVGAMALKAQPTSTFGFHADANQLISIAYTSRPVRIQGRAKITSEFIPRELGMWDTNYLTSGSEWEKNYSARIAYVNMWEVTADFCSYYNSSFPCSLNAAGATMKDHTIGMPPGTLATIDELLPG
jgi:hypothetical protein